MLVIVVIFVIAGISGYIKVGFMTELFITYQHFSFLKTHSQGLGRGVVTHCGSSFARGLGTNNHCITPGPIWLMILQPSIAHSSPIYHVCHLKPLHIK